MGLENGFCFDFRSCQTSVVAQFDQLAVLCIL